MSDLENCIPIGGELGTSSSKFCCDDIVVTFSSVVGTELSEEMEKSWRMMNRSNDLRWIKNLAIFDDSRNAWRYVGAMTRSSEKTNWFTNKGLIQNYDDAFTAIRAGLFLLNLEMEKRGKSVRNVGFGFGITVRHGENVLENFLSYMAKRLTERDGKKILPIKAKNVATNEVKEIEVQLNFSVMQYQAYGAYFAILFGKYKMEVYNTYVIDIGHGTWIKLPIIDNEADILLSDSITEGVHTITKNVSNAIFEASGQKFKIPEQRIMERLPTKDYAIEVPGAGVFNFGKLLAEESSYLAKDIVQRVSADISALSARGQTIDYFTIIGGGAHLLFDTIKSELAGYFGWSPEVADYRVVNPASLGVDPRYINCVGFMLLARDQIAVELGREVDPRFTVSAIIKDSSSQDEEGLDMKDVKGAKEAGVAS